VATLIALLRGINVGGHGKVAMEDLRRSFSSLGHRDVRTYIQSGNVLFRPPAGGRAPSAEVLGRRLSEELGTQVTVVLRTAAELALVVEANPFAEKEDPRLVYVTFLARAATPERAAELTVPPGTTDELALVGREVYLHCPGGYARTKLNNTFIERRLGVEATTRGWNTVTTLLDLASG
jgi:uncharacterized protein (DUF1697 family)